MRKRISTSTVAALALFTFVGLVAALAIAWPNLARAHSPGGASLTALTVTSDALTLTVTSGVTPLTLTLTPTFDSAVHYYTIPVADTVTQITIEATPEDDGSVAYQNMDGTTLTDADASADGMQVNIPTAGKRINVEVTHIDGMEVLEETYGVLVIRDGPAVPDLLVLMELYNSTDGANWKGNPNWGSTKPFEEWDALVTVNNDNERIQLLALDAQNLVGTIPASLGTLDKMKVLDLSFNKLSGPIPEELGNLAYLLDLALHENQLSGPIPVSLGALANLQLLWLAKNRLTGPIPAELGNLIELQQLHLYGNDLTGPIPDLSKLTDLYSLRLAENQLTGPITGLSSLTKLEYLTLPNNQLSGEITGLSSLTRLVELKLFNNQFTGEIPDSLSRLTRLTWLSLAGNRFTGEIPASLGSHGPLRHLFLDRNQLDGPIPEELGSLNNLITLNLGDNQLTGTIPEELGNLRKLDFLYLDNNQLSGPIPAELGRLGGLRVTRFAGNPSLTGCVPNGLRYLMNAPAVTMLDPEATDAEMLTLEAQDFVALGLPFCTLSSLTLSGVTLQQAFASDTVVYTASVTHDVESTTVAATLHNRHDPISIMKGAATYMNSDSVPLDVGQNVITIAISPPNGTPTHTYTVTILRAEGDQAALMALYNSAGGASWTGKTNWGSTTEPLNTWFGVEADSNGNVTELALPGNTLSGTLPAALGSLISLTTLDLSDNQLSGTIPDLTALTQLQTLNLSANQLSGTIPDLSTLTQLQTLNLSANQLSGTIPDLGALSSLTTLNLGENQLSGTIPDWLSSLTGLRDLSLRDNRLTGPIPEELRDLNQLYLLYLDNNQLSGPIPAELGSLTSLQQLYLNGNQLSGCVPDGLRTGLNHDFIAVDANGDGDTADVGDTPGLPFCTLSSLTFSGDVTLNPVFTSSTTTYTATAAHGVQITTVTARLNNSSNTVSITKGVDTYTSGDQVPLDVGSDVITLEVTRADDPLTTHTYTVTVTRQPNTQPTFDEGMATTRGVDENTPAGQIGDPVRATDTENDTLTYSLDATGAASFKIDESSGQLRTKAALDYEDKSSYTVTVSVRDSLDANGDADEVTDDTIRVTIQVTNVNDAPVFPSETVMRSVDEKTPAGEDIGAPVAASDDDDDPLTYSLDSSTDADSFSIDAASGQLRTRAALDYETGPNSYIVDVTAADPSGANDRITVTITVNNVDEEGTVTLSTTQPIEGTLLDATLDDPDEVSGSVTWSWRRSQSRTSLGTLISGATAATYTPVAADVDRFLRATASYTDEEDSGKSAQAVSTNRVGPAPVAPNEQPQFPSNTTSRNVGENTPADTNIGAPVTATDSNNDTLTYSLDLTSRATFNMVATTGQLQTKAALDYETGTSTYSVTVTATDPAGLYDTIEVTITVNNVDEPGTVTLSTTQPIVAIQLTATLDDPDDVSGSATWLWEGSPNGSSSWTPISGATSATYTPVTADVGDYLRATASYDDGEGSGKSAEGVSANVVQAAPAPMNEAPVFSSNTMSRNVDENTARGVNIGAPVTATDPNNDTLTYSLDVPSRATFNMVATTGRLQTKAALDYETGPNSYTVTVTATDPAGLFDTIEVTITVNNVDEPGTVTLSSLQPIEGIPLTATLDDPDVVDPASVTWSWRRSQSRTSLGTLISGATSATYTPDADAEGRFLRATASYTDGEDSGKSAQAVSTNKVRPAPAPPNEPPQFPSNTATRDVDENTVAGRDIGEPVTATDLEDNTLTYSLDTAGAASFDINKDTGQLRTKAALDFETTDTYSVTVTATDTAGATGTISVSITVNNLDEPGTVTLSSQQPLVAIGFTATLDDPDGVSDSVTWSWESSSDQDDWAVISGATSSGLTSTYTPVAGDVDDYLRATASYDDGHGPDKSALAISASAVELAPGRNAPVFTDGPTTTRSIPRNTPAGVNIGAPVSATDADNDALTYSLGGPDATEFDLNRSSGQLLTKEVLTGIDRTSYEVMVSVSDSKDDFGNPETNPIIDTSTTVTITITTVTVTRPSGGSSGGGGGGGGGSANRPPEITGPKNLQYPENSTEPVATYEAVDPEGTAIRWEIEDTDEEHFRISEDGVLSFKKPPDYENPVDFRLNNTYEIRLLAFDSGRPSRSDRLQVRIEIKDVDLPGVPEGYDANDDEMIALEETIVAVAAFSEGVITREEATAIIKLYFSNPTHGNEGDTP